MTGLPRIRPAHAAARVLRLGQGSTPESPPGVGCTVFAQAVAAHPVLAPVLKLDVRHRAELGDDMTMLRSCLDGMLDMAVCGTTVVSSIVPEIGVLDTPFLFKNIPNARATLDGAPGLEFVDLLKAKGINFIGWVENGVRHITANKPVRKPADLVGMKLRVPPSEVVMASFRALGANPGPLPFPAIYEALRTGTFDAEENPIGLIEASRLYEVQKYISLTGHAYSAALFIASQDMLDDLTPEQHTALIECAKQGQAATRMAADAAQRGGVARLRDAGMGVVDDVDMEAFVAAARPNLEIMGSKFGIDRVHRLANTTA
jgi:tripartite ATP-independent transporter DctP family solute receptor